MTARSQRITLAVTSGIAVAIFQASRELRFGGLFDALPPLENQIRSHWLIVWLLLTAVSGLASFAAAFLASRASGSRLAPVVPVAILVLLIGSTFPLYWYIYRGAPEGLHINIPAVERYTPPLSIAVALIVYSLAGLVIRRSGSRSDA